MRVYVMEQLLDDKVTLKQASYVLGLSERQIKKLKTGVREKGVPGTVCPWRACLHNVMSIPLSGLRIDTSIFAFMKP